MSALCGLPRAAALCKLAACVYDVRAEVYGLPSPPFEALTWSERNIYMEKAKAVLESLEPAPAAERYLQLTIELTRAEGTKIVGRISPAEPYGIDTSDGRD